MTKACKNSIFLIAPRGSSKITIIGHYGEKNSGKVINSNTLSQQMFSNNNKNNNHSTTASRSLNIASDMVETRTVSDPSSSVCSSSFC